MALPLKLHPGQLEVFTDPRRFKVVVAGRRWGKTQLAKTSLIKKAASKKNQLVWYVAPTYGMARSIMWQELLDSIPRRWVVKINETRMTIRLRNGSRIELKGADKPDTLRGVGLHYLVIDEAQDIKEATWKLVLRPTLASTLGDATFIGTPKAFNWLYDLYMLGRRGSTYLDKSNTLKKNAWVSWQFPTITSPFIAISEIMEAKADMDGKSFRQEFEASFETMSGRVYYAFDRQHNTGSFAFNPKLPIWIGQDFNIDPMSSVILQPQDDGELWLVDEIVMFGSNTQEVADEIGRRYFRHLKSITMFPDPAGSQRSHGRGESDLQILREAGLKRMIYKRKHPKVTDRVNSVNRMLRSADGRVRLKIDHRCKHAIAALEKTIYKPGTREVDKSLGVEHAADAIGYPVDIKFPSKILSIIGTSM